jgi:lauroyl/myristoyl acyltransferase
MTSAPRVPLIGIRDLVLLAAFGAGYVLTALTPRRWDEHVVRLSGSLVLIVWGGSVRRLAGRMEKSLPLAKSAEESIELARGHFRLRVELWWGRFRGLRYRGWRPIVELDGAEHLRRALEAGRGVVLWRMNFCENPVFLQALTAHGVSAVHLSDAAHGAPSGSRLGLRWTSPLYCRAEEPYAAERIVIPLDRSLGYIRELLDRLGQNAVVSIVGENRGRNNVTVSILGSDVELATGAPALAAKSGAALLTAHVVRLRAFRYRLMIHDPIEIDRSFGRKEFVKLAAHEFARRLDAQIEKHPVEWMGWLRKRYPVVAD